MKDKMIQLTDINTSMPMFIDATLIVSIEPKNDEGVSMGSKIQSLLPKGQWLYQCSEFTNTVNELRVQKLEELEGEPLNRFQMMDL